MKSNFNKGVQIMKDAYDFNLDLLEVNGIEHKDGFIKEIDEIGRIKLETLHKDTDYSIWLKKLYNLGKKDLNDVDCDEIRCIIEKANKNNWIELEDTALLLLKARNNYFEYYCNLGTDLCIDMSDYKRLCNKEGI